VTKAEEPNTDAYYAAIGRRVEAERKAATEQVKKEAEEEAEKERLKKIIHEALEEDRNLQTLKAQKKIDRAAQTGVAVAAVCGFVAFLSALGDETV